MARQFPYLEERDDSYLQRDAGRFAPAPALPQEEVMGADVFPRLARGARAVAGDIANAIRNNQAGILRTANVPPEFASSGARSTAVAGMRAAEGVDQPASSTPKASAPDARPAASNIVSGPVSGRPPGGYPDFTRNEVAPPSPYRVRGSGEVPNFGFAAPPQFQGSRDSFDPNMFTQLQELDSRISELSNSKGIADSWRRGQLRKARSRLVGDNVRIANERTAARNADTQQFGQQINAFRASNEVPLARLADFTQRRGQDLTVDVANMRNDTERYGIESRSETERYGVDTRSGDTRRGQDFDIARSGADVAKGLELRRLQAANAPLEDVQAVTDAYSPSRATKGPTTERFTDRSGGEGIVIINPDGTREVLDPTELARLSALRRQNETARRLNPQGK